jgi:hypothetical protein
MIRKFSAITLGMAFMVLMFSFPAFAEAPNFTRPAIYADGEVWATKGLNPFPAPNGKNNQSFDFLFLFNNGAEGQLPVAEAAPRNPKYNGGRWNVYSAEWNEGFNPHIVKSYAELMGLVADGYITISRAGIYFECPLLPFKG